jgi:hypothetical protein
MVTDTDGLLGEMDNEFAKILTKEDSIRKSTTKEVEFVSVICEFRSTRQDTSPKPRLVAQPKRKYTHVRRSYAMYGYDLTALAHECGGIP